VGRSASGKTVRGMVADRGDPGNRATTKMVCESALALALQAALLLNSGSPAAALFVASRLQGRHGLAFGTLPASEDIDALVARALP
jgi:putative acyl-CoA dehydrogenase